MDWRKIKKIHFIGIGGIGVSAIAKMFLSWGKIVTGSDLVFSEITRGLEKQGIKIFQGHKADQVSPGTDLVIYSPAVPEDNPERKRARKLKIPQLSYPEFLGELSKDKFTIAVSGTNGKTTTTAMLGIILEQAGLDPTVIVGSRVELPNWQGNLRLSQDLYPQKFIRNSYIRNKFVIRSPFVVEACEWRAHMLKIKPKVIVLTNIEEDHLDYYRGLNHIIETFQKYIESLPSEGKLILNADDSSSLKLKPNCQVITYGIQKKAGVAAKDIRVRTNKQCFRLASSKFKLHTSDFILQVPGIFNIYNGLAAASAALALGVDLGVIKKALAQFPGIWRRFEVKELKIGNCKLKIVNDYAHHPTAIKETIKAAKEFYPERRIMAVFQPHQHNRTKNLFNDFVKSFDQADLIILSEIFDVAGREEKKDQDISSRDLAKAIEKRRERGVLYAENLEATQKLILQNIQPNDIVLIMGAGDIYKIASKLVS